MSAHSWAEGLAIRTSHVSPRWRPCCPSALVARCVLSFPGRMSLSPVAPRHAGRIHLKVGVKRDGTITAIQGTSRLNTGGYVASGPGVARRAGQGIIYLYHCPNVLYESYLAYTNCPSAGSYRALGAPQGHFALETLMDRIAEELVSTRWPSGCRTGCRRKASPDPACRHRTRLSTASPLRAAFLSPATAWRNA